MIHPKIPHRKIYLLFLSLTIFGLAMGKSLMSMGIIGLSVNWILEGNFKYKWNRITIQKYLPIIFLLFFIVQLIWGIFSENLQDSFKDLKRLLPFVAIPIVVSSSKKLESKEIKWILHAYIAGVVLSSSVGFYKFLVGDFTDYRDLSIFVSHIRLGLFVAMAIGICGFLWSLRSGNSRHLYLLIILYLLFFLRILESGTGYFAGGLALILAIYYISYMGRLKWVIYSSGLFFLFAFAFLFFKAYSEYSEITNNQELDINQLDVYTSMGNLYEHHPEITLMENGNRIYSYYCPAELGPAWLERSSIHIDSLDKKGQPIHGTIMRYMTSLGIRKDHDGVVSLSAEDIINIENGLTSAEPQKHGITERIQEIIFEYIAFRNNLDPNGHSLIQRLYYIEAGWNIFKAHPIFGVTPSCEDSYFKTYYSEAETPLLEQHQLKSHNQFLSFLVRFGIIGTLLIICSFILPIIKSPFTYMSILFISIALIGSFTDDILDRQAGVTFIAVFYSLVYLSDQALNRNNVITDPID